MHFDFSLLNSLRNCIKSSNHVLSRTYFQIYHTPHSAREHTQTCLYTAATCDIKNKQTCT